MTTDIVPGKRPRNSKKTLADERKRMLTEMAAAAYVRMKHNDYKYPEGSRRGGRQEDGTYINKRELMRIAGYKVDGTNTHYERLEENEYYQQMITLYEKRYSDPLFRDDEIAQVWTTVGNEALRNVYERLVYYPHELSVEQLLKVLKTVLDAGVQMQKIGQESGKSSKLISKIKDPELREEIKEDYKRKLQKELDALEGDV